MYSTCFRSMERESQGARRGARALQLLPKAIMSLMLQWLEGGREGGKEGRREGG
jgi:hypothetical protein